MANDLASLLLERSGYTGSPFYGARGDIDPATDLPGAFDLPLGRGANEEFALHRRTPYWRDIEELHQGMGLKPAPAGGLDHNPPPARPLMGTDAGDLHRRNSTNGRFSSRGWRLKKMQRER